MSAKIEGLKALKTGKGLQYLLNEGCRIIGNPILVQDMEYNLISYTENIITDDPIWNEYITTGSVKKETLEFFKNELFLDAAANTKKTTFLLSDKLKYDRTYGKIFNGNNVQIGCAVLMASNKCFEDGDAGLFDIFCDKINEEIAENKYYLEYGQQYYEKLINKLIDGDISDKRIYEPNVESLYINLNDNLFLAAIDVSLALKNINNEDTGILRKTNFESENCISLLKNSFPEYKFSLYKNYIIIILSSEKTSIKSEIKKLEEFAFQNNIYIGISSRFDNFFELNKYYTEAVGILSRRLKNSYGKHIFFYNKK